MATSQITDYSTVPTNRPFVWSWSGIFCGTFMYIAIESTFGLLAAAIFTSVSSPNSAALPTSSPMWSTGFQVWMIVLSIIALYFAGKTASKLLYGAGDRNLGMYHGLVTFGMSIVATLLVVALAAGTTSGMATRPGGIGNFINNSGEWWLFVAFILSMASAAAGGMHGVRNAPPAVGERSATTKRAA